MGMSWFWATIGCIFNAALVLVLAPLFEGILRKVTARVQSRKGPPLLQPYYDLFKLLGKEDIESGETPWAQRFAAWLSMGVVLAAVCFVPMGFRAPLGGAGDALVLIYLLMLGGLCTLMAGLAAGSTYSLLGMSREMMLMITLEPLFAVAMIVGAVHANSLRLDAVLGGAVYEGRFGVSGLLMLAVSMASFQALVQRVPFDIPEAETEIMEGPLSEYSGPKLALFKWARMAKLVVYAALFVALFVPWGSGLPFPVGLGLFWCKVLVLVLLVTLVAATHARYRVDQAVRYFGGMLVIAVVALILATYGY
jgi:formate hydrogenlyase subunit 4